MGNRYEVAFGEGYLESKEQFLHVPRALREITRMEQRLARTGTDGIKNTHRVGNRWTIRLGEGRRLLIIKEGRQIVLDLVDNHDDAYMAAERRACPELPHVVNHQVAGDRTPTDGVAGSANGLLAHLDDTLLSRLGVTPDLLELVRSAQHHDALWALIDSLGDDLTQRLLQCLEDPPSNVLAEYESRGKDDVYQGLLLEAEAQRDEERKRTKSETAALSEQVTHLEAELDRERAEKERARLEPQEPTSWSEPDDDRLADLERRYEQLTAMLETSLASASEGAPDSSTPLADVGGSASPSGSPVGRVPQTAGGRERWRLSARHRSLTRVSDGADLASFVGHDQAAGVVFALLSRRPEGGRVWLDADGRTSTYIGGAPVELGVVVPGRLSVPSTPHATARGSKPGSLAEHLAQALLRSPGSSARELVAALARDGCHVSKREVNSLLYRDSSFVSDAGSVPRWRCVTGLAAPTARTNGATSPRHRVAEKRVIRAAPSERPQPRLTPPKAGRRSFSPLEARSRPADELGLLVWQTEALDRWYAAGCQGIVEAVTGTGKTHVGLQAVSHAAGEGRQTTVLVPSVDLQDQWFDRFTSWLPHLTIARVGGRRSGSPRSSDVTIALVQSASRQALVDGAGDALLVADEVHRYGAESFQYALRAGYRDRLGLTATLERADDAIEDVLDPYFRGTVMTVGFDRAIREEVVAPFRLVLAPIRMSEDEQEEYDTLSQQVSNALQSLRRAGALSGAGSVAQQLGRLGGAGGPVGKAARSAQDGMRRRRRHLATLEGKLEAVEELAEVVDASEGTVLFTQSKDVAEQAAERLREWDVPASALHSDMTIAERSASLRDLADGHVQALAAPKLLDEGIDLPTVDLGIVMTASSSRRQMVQRLGRVIRRKADGRPVDFVILYAEDSVEDPASGEHEGFFDLVGEVAVHRLALEAGWTARDLARGARVTSASIEPSGAGACPDTEAWGRPVMRVADDGS